MRQTHQAGWDQGAANDMDPAMGGHDVRHQDASRWAAGGDHKVAIWLLVDLHAHTEVTI